MKRVFSFLLVVSILCTLAVPCFAANPSVSINTVNAATVGETITVSVNLSANSNLAGLKLSVNFNSSEFQLVSGSAQKGKLFDLEIPTENTSSVDYAGVSDKPVNSSGTVLTFKLKILKTGGKITININEAIDGDNKNISVGTSGATVKCSHANAKWVVTKKATCTEKGSESRECSCGDKATREIALVNHSFGDWVITKKATETEKGAKERICKVCAKKELIDIAKIAPTQTVTDIETETQTQVPTVTQSETQTETQPETQTETTTIPQSQDTPKDNAKPVVVGAIFFAVGIAVGIGATLFIIKRKAKEEE